MNDKERLEMETRLIEETQRIGKTVREIIPEGGNMTLIWWPDGHAHIQITGPDADKVLCAFSTNEGEKVIQL